MTTFQTISKYTLTTNCTIGKLPTEILNYDVLKQCFEDPYKQKV